MGSPRVIEAAGGVLWRPAVGGSGVEVGLVHRPKYDDWSMPKGKLNACEHPLLGALREVWEETGHVAEPGRPIGEIHYLKDGAPKRVRYWAMRLVDGHFLPNAEVDQMMWLPPREAQHHLLPERDRRIVVEFARDPAPTWPCVLIRHGSAGERAGWPGDDRERPLDEFGREQAEQLTPLLDAYGVQRVVSADVLRCLDTVGPYATLRQVPVESEPLMSETGTSRHADAAVERLLELCTATESLAVCSQGKALPHLIAGVCERLGFRPPSDRHTPKGGFWVLHLTLPESGPKPVLSGIERLDPPATGDR